jgi:hypothetical protein
MLLMNKPGVIVFGFCGVPQRTASFADQPVLSVFPVVPCGGGVCR